MTFANRRVYGQAGAESNLPVMPSDATAEVNRRSDIPSVKVGHAEIPTSRNAIVILLQCSGPFLATSLRSTHLQIHASTFSNFVVPSGVC